MIRPRPRLESLDRILAHMIRSLLLQEERRLSVLRIVLRRFEVTGDPRDQTRRQAVYDWVAQEMDVVANNELGELVRDSLGSVRGVKAIARSNVRLFRGLRIRADMPQDT